METDYIVSVTATNECGDESQASENIIVRIDIPGTVWITYIHVYIKPLIYCDCTLTCTTGIFS